MRFGNGHSPFPQETMRANLPSALLFLIPAVSLTAAPVIDDRALISGFEKGLGELADVGLPLVLKEARATLEELSDCVVTLPEGCGAIEVDEEAGLYASCIPAVVAVGTVYDCGHCDEWHLGGFATGWIASADGVVVTNYHVVDKDNDHLLGVMTPDGRVFPVVEVLTGNKAGDAAVLRIDTGGESLPWLRLAPGAQVGEKVGVISHPSRRLFVYTQGVVSRFHTMPQRNADGKAPVFMSITADYAVGSSGGPVVNARGEVVGMVASTSTVTAGGSRNRSEGEDGDEEGASPRRTPGAVQMVFKDSVSPQVLNALIQYGRGE